MLENKVKKAINIIKNNKGKNNINFFDAHILLLLEALKKNDLNTASNHLVKLSYLVDQDRIKLAILEIFKQYTYVFKNKKILDNKKFGKLSIISETFERCF